MNNFYIQDNLIYSNYKKSNKITNILKYLLCVYIANNLNQTILNTKNNIDILIQISNIINIILNLKSKFSNDFNFYGGYINDDDIIIILQKIINELNLTNIIHDKQVMLNNLNNLNLNLIIYKILKKCKQLNMGG